MNEDDLNCPWCVEYSMRFIGNHGSNGHFRCKICTKTITIKDDGHTLVNPCE